ncbi:aminoglycoside phosphotransferase family protein [Vannielia litorea]|uniref:aminoglycoside phosphotransferase family protein n=1 Tax=Vannielia litorea TaxID=1217970 RepID=UPI001BD027DF|nr:phosphotransferase [Vannielia litorea]MBS8224875.1 aminoglycoside phosphotransferase [Vannielia litorea]
MSDIGSFLSEAGWGGAERAPLAGDASSRSYERLALGPDRAVLMKDPDGNIRPFLDIAAHLVAEGLSAPRILAHDAAAGLILMEDLGNALIAKRAVAHPEEEVALYRAATDVLVALHGAPVPPGLSSYGPAEMALAIGPAAEFYAPAAGAPVTHEGWLQLTATIEEALLASDMEPQVMLHRDYHAENLLWLPERAGPARIGLLDFQDALLGHRAYDLASLLGDVRRDVPPTVKEAAVLHYLDATGVEEGTFRMALAAQGAQRNIRILGIFARLCTRLGKPAYLDLMPRVWTLLMADLAHPALTTLREAVLDTLPEPTPDALSRIRKVAA